MHIVNLIEDTAGAQGCVCAHGLSFYVETEGHRLLSDLGPSAQTLANAARLGVPLSGVDTVILSHGHYDHCGGLLSFAGLCPDAEIYMQRSALGAFYADDGPDAAGPRWRYIGVDPQIAALPRLRLLDGDFRLDGALSVFVTDRRAAPISAANARLRRKRGAVYLHDSFSHEQSLVIREGEKRVLLSGCAHNGILNILDAFARKYGGAPDAVISGFHLSKRGAYTEAEVTQIRGTAQSLLAYPTRFYTCHCTGLLAFAQMRSILGERLEYLHCGDSLTL